MKKSLLQSIPKRLEAQRLTAFFIILILCFSRCAARAEAPELPKPMDGVSPEDVDWSLVEEEEAAPDVPLLALDEFCADDVPEDYLTPAEHPGRVEKIYYYTTSSDGHEEVKSVLVYYPAGYDDSEDAYNVLYILHGSGGSVKNYLNIEKTTSFQCLLDHMIENGELSPLIVVAATYYASDGYAQALPLAQQVEITAKFPRELTEDLIPEIEEQCRTFAASPSQEDIAASREHRAIAGFSLGGVATWYVFLQQMRAFKWYLPISEASWDDGEGGTSGIWNSDVSARTLYDAVLDQGYGWRDFMLFVATGTEDEAFEISTNQMKSLLEYDEMFLLGENTSCSMMIDGKHNMKAVYTYLYYILPALFADPSS